MCATHEKLKQQVLVRVLVIEADPALLLEVDGVDEGHGALVPVGLQVASLRHPGGASWQNTIVLKASHSDILPRIHK